MPFKFPKGTRDAASFVSLPARISENPAIQSKLRQLLQGVLYKSELSLLNCSDVPVSYVGSGDYDFAVKEDESGFEFVESAGEGGTASVETTRVKIKITSTKSIATNTWTAISWDASDFDTGSYWSSGTNITMPADGDYYFTGWAEQYVGFSSTPFQVMIDIRDVTAGAVIARSSVCNSIGRANSRVAFITARANNCSSGDAIQMRIFQTFGSSLTLYDAHFICWKMA